MGDKNHYVNRKFKVRSCIFDIQKYKLRNFISQNRGRTRHFYINFYSGRKKFKIGGKNKQCGNYLFSQR